MLRAAPAKCKGGRLTLPGGRSHRVAADPSPPDRCPMNRPLTNFQMRDAEAPLHPYTDAAALRRPAPSSSSAARASGSGTSPAAR